MSKKAASKKQTKRSWGRYIFVGVIILVAALPALFFGTKLWLDAADSRKFATLQLDFKKLQSEFNKIDPGWGYSEWCTAGGKYDDYKTCGVDLGNTHIPATHHSENDVADIYARAGLDEAIFYSVVRDSSYTGKDGIYHAGRALSRRGINDGICEITSKKNNENIVVTLSCRDEGRSFYFNRVDR